MEDTENGNSLVLFEVSVFSAEPDEGKHYNIKAYTNKDDPPEEVWREEWHQSNGERFKNDKKEGPVDGISVEVLFLLSTIIVSSTYAVNTNLLFGIARCRLLRENARQLFLDDIYKNPGPLQFDGPGGDSRVLSLCVEDLDYMGRIKKLNEYLEKNSLVLFEVSVFSAEADEGKHYNIKAYTNKDDPPEEAAERKRQTVDLDYMGRIKKLNEYLEKLRAMVKPGYSQDDVKAALSAMSSVMDILSYSIVGYTPEDLTCIDKVINLFESWVSKHGKFYDSLEEKLHRLEIFKDNLKHIDETNKKASNYWLGLNEFADLSHEEFKNMFLGLKGELPEKREESSEAFTYRDFVDLPKSVDWRKKGAVAPVKNQGSCDVELPSEYYKDLLYKMHVENKKLKDTFKSSDSIEVNEISQFQMQQMKEELTFIKSKVSVYDKFFMFLSLVVVMIGIVIAISLVGADLQQVLVCNMLVCCLASLSACKGYIGCNMTLVGADLQQVLASNIAFPESSTGSDSNGLECSPSTTGASCGSSTTCSSTPSCLPGIVLAFGGNTLDISLQSGQKDIPPTGVKLLRENARQLFLDDVYRNPGPLQFDGLGADSRVLSLCVEDLDYMGRIKKLNEYLEKVRAMVKPGCSQDVVKAGLSAMSSVTDILSVMSSPSNSTT
ncbi:cysteine protease XCP1-like protein [Tanacetum coccineum]